MLSFLPHRLPSLDYTSPHSPRTTSLPSHGSPEDRLVPSCSRLGSGSPPQLCSHTLHLSPSVE